MYLGILSVGGPIFIVILLVAGVGLFFFFERFIVLSQVKASLAKGETSNPFILKLHKKIINMRGARLDELNEIIDIEINRLYKNFRIITTAITIAPLLGLLGTTTGMIKIFNTLERSESLKYVKELASGIGEALYTTIAGLIVAIALTVLISVLKEIVSSIQHDLMDRYLKTSNI